MRLVRISLLTVLLSGLLLGANTDPVIGRWKLNWEKSQSERAAPKSVIRKYAKVRDGFRVSEVWRGQDGSITKFSYTAKYDGQEYPTSHEGGGTITFTRRDANVAEGMSCANAGQTEEAAALLRAAERTGKRLPCPSS